MVPSASFTDHDYQSIVPSASFTDQGDDEEADRRARQRRRRKMMKRARKRIMRRMAKQVDQFKRFMEEVRFGCLLKKRRCQVSGGLLLKRRLHGGGGMWLFIKNGASANGADGR